MMASARHSAMPLALMTVAHPGVPSSARALFVPTAIGSSLRMHVASGDDLFTAVHRRLDALGAPGGAFTLLSGEFASLTIMTGGVGRDGFPMGFCGPHEIAAPARLAVTLITATPFPCASRIARPTPPMPAITCPE